MATLGVTQEVKLGKDLGLSGALFKATQGALNSTPWGSRYKHGLTSYSTLMLEGLADFPEHPLLEGGHGLLVGPGQSLAGGA